MAIRRRSIATAIVALVLVGVAGAVWWQPAKQQQQPRFGRGGGGDDGPVPVVAALAKRSDVPVYLDGVGTIRALNTVTVRSQVDGKLLSVNYTEGQQVERGYVLARIDPTTYQAAYDQAVAKKALDEATLANARLDLERYTKLVASNSIARQQLDTQRMLVAQQEAQVKLDQAQIDNAKAILDYTQIVAPITGRTGIRQVDQGNVVHASDANGIVVITQLQPLSVLFTLPQQQLGEVNRAFAAGPLPVDAFGPDNKTIVETGELKVVDNQVDPSTGTIKLKAEFANRELQLWPGGFINVRLLTHTLKQVVVAPTAAVQRGPSGTFVYVVQPDNKVAVRPVTVSQQDEAQAVVAKGLEAGERVVTTGFARLTAGAAVAVIDAGSAPSPDAQPVEPPRQRRRGGQGQQRSEATPSAGPSTQQ
jgi:multidrug efflux system membrane fusion protein